MEFQRKGQERLGRADISWGGSNPADTIPSFVFCHTSIFALASCTDPLMRVPLPSFWCLIRHSPPLNNQHYTVSFQVLPHHLCHLPPFFATVYTVQYTSILAFFSSAEKRGRIFYNMHMVKVFFVSSGKMTVIHTPVYVMNKQESAQCIL